MIAQRLHGARLHLSHGPIDVVLRAWGSARDVAAAEEAAAARFDGMLEGLVAELPALRSAASDALRLEGAVARRMLTACLPFARQGTFVTLMAAVAGAVADELLGAMRAAAPGLRKAFVNDGGDIAVFVGTGESMAVGMVEEVTLTMPPPRPSPVNGGGRVLLCAGDGIGGVATSGQHGRSFSLGIADAVTVVAKDAATADAAATLIANAVDTDSPAIRRAPARSLDPDSDLGDLPVTIGVGPLTAAEIAAALDAGGARAEAWCRAGLIRGAALRLAGAARFAGAPFPALPERAA
jgi:ApbE superfamily uncharacterized protein (UPF0280 family)